MRTIAFALSLVFIFSIPWEGVSQLPGLGSAAKALGFVVAAVWLATIIMTGRFRKPSPFHMAVLLFVLWNAVSVFWSANPHGTADQVMTWAQLLIFVFMVWDLCTTRTALLAGLQAYVLGACVALGSALANFASGKAFYTNYSRFSSGDTNPDGFGFILVLGMPVAWYLAGLQSATRMGRLLKLVNYAYIPAAFLGIALSGTRTSLVAAIPALAFGLASLTRLRLAARVAIFLSLTAALLNLLPYVQTLASFQRFSTTAAALSEGDLNQRTYIWREGLDSFVEHPLIGVGSSMYRSVNSLGKVAHNSFLSVLVEVGLIGFALFGMILAMAVSQARGQPKWDKRFWLTLLAVWAIGASTLTWEHRKSTWLFLSLIVASAALTIHRDEAVPLVQRDKSEGQFVWQAK
ncbi:MAG TPA: O-antigen ligase family protein [Pyrinomonadaceae bacterium]|nr:O-antigen ligase family protein [Pyrinomonadaceae bacterium]